MKSECDILDLRFSKDFGKILSIKCTESAKPSDLVLRFIFVTRNLIPCAFFFRGVKILGNVYLCISKEVPSMYVRHKVQRKRSWSNFASDKPGQAGYLDRPPRNRYVNTSIEVPQVPGFHLLES